MEEKRLKNAALLTTTLSSFLTPLSLSTVNIALPSMGREFSLDAVSLSWIMTSYLLSSSILLLPFGKMADMYGRKKIFLAGIFVFTISSFLIVFSSGPFMLIMLRVAQGCGGAMIFGTAVAVLTSVFPEGERGRVLGINVASVYLGLSVGPFVGGILTEYYGWRSVFLLNVPFGIIVILLTLARLKKEWAEERKGSFDFKGAIFYSLSIFLLIYGFSILPRKIGFFLVFFAIFLLFLFLVLETRVSNPILQVGLFRNNKAFTFSNLAALLNYSAASSLVFLLSLYLQHIKEFTPKRAGLILFFQPLVQAAISPLAGRFSDKVEPRIIASIGMMLTATGLFLFSSLNLYSSMSFFVSCLFITGLGFGFFSSPNTNAVMTSVEKKNYGVASSLLATMRILGQMFSMGIATMIFSLYMGKLQIIPSTYGLLLKSIRLTLFICSFLCILGILASLSRGEVKQRKKKISF